MNSFLRFQACNIDAEQTCVVNHSADMFIQKVEVLHAGNVLETIDNYGTLSAIMLDCQVDTSIRNTSINMTKGCSGTVGAIAGPSQAKLGDATANRYYSLTLLSGICGSLCRNYIPVFELQGSLQLRITFANSYQFGPWSAVPTTASNSNFKFNNIEFHANMIKLSEPILEMVKAQNYTIYSETCTNFQQTIASTVSSIEQLIPTRYSSLKTIFVSQREQHAVLNDATTPSGAWKGNPNTRCTFKISDYCFRLGPKQIPPTRVRCEGYGYVDAFEALKVAFHCGGNTLASMGVLNATNYVVDKVDDLTGLFVIGQDLESYSGKSGSLLSGISTLGSDLYFSANYGDMTVPALLDFFLHYDMKLVIANGVLTINV